MSIRVAILGYGNLGKGMECAVKQNDDMELVAVFTRRDPATVKTLTDVKVYNVDQLLSMQDKIDVLVLCGGSGCGKTTLLKQLRRLRNRSAQTDRRVCKIFQRGRQL